ncbi:tyrosine-type recombinase/integrase [Cryomorphaceae bacterium 1068]|nr:tyrosine-type recombinase/integrase [Cryomorphaceae bacterium 1068]
MIEKFLAYLQFEKNYSLHTVNAYHGDLENISFYLTTSFECGLEDATHQFLRSWMVDALESGSSASTIKRRVSALKSFYKWRKKTFGVQVDPTAKLVIPKMPKRLPVFVEEVALEVGRQGACFDESHDGIRDQAIIELFYNTGIRSAELIGLKMDSVDFEQGAIKVLGKRNKERIVPVGQPMIDALKTYLLARYDLQSIHDKDYFFLTQKGKKLYPRLVYRIVNDYLSKVSSISKKSPHVLRHTFATHMLNKGADINAIKELLGHSSLAATQVYTHNSVEQLIKVYRSSHPKS